MKGDVSLLNKRSFVVNDKITVHIPTIREIRGNTAQIVSTESDEAKYFNLVNMFSATPCDIMLELHKQGIDFTKWTDYKTFLMMFQGVDRETLREKSFLLFENINLADFELSVNMENQLPILYDQQHDIVIDEMIYLRLSSIICGINSIQKNHRKMGNETMKNYAIEREEAHRRNRRNKNQPYSSRYDKQIIALVNNANFKYDFETVNDLTVYDFAVSVKQITKKYQVDNLYTGMYMGTVKLSASERSDKLNWLDYE